jgi:hypothetical protein
MLIYCAGCSQTEGSGLADAVVFPNEYPGDVDINKLSRVSWTNTRSSLLSKDPFLFEKLRQENLKRAWPAHLERITGHTVINGAVGGASIQSMSMTLIHDIEKLIQSGQVPNEVIIGITSIERISLLNLYPINDYTTLAFKNVMPSFVSNIEKRYARYCEEYWTSHSDEEMLTFYLYHCVMMQNYVISKIGKPPIFVKTVLTHDWESIVTTSNIFLLKEYWNLLNFKDFVQSKGLEEFAEPPNIVLPDGHFKENAHERFAKYISEVYLDV